MSQDVYLNLKSLSAYIGIPEATIYYYASKRKIPFYKPSKSLIFKKSEIDEWVESSRVSTVDEIQKGLKS